MTEREKNNLVGVLFAMDRYTEAGTTNAEVLVNLAKKIELDNETKEIFSDINTILEDYKNIRNVSDKIHEALAKAVLKEKDDGKVHLSPM